MMIMPPLVSGASYPLLSATQTRSNYLSAGLTTMTTYNDNVLVGSSAHPVSDIAYTLLSTFTYDQTSPRQQRTFIYSPGFTFYQNTSGLNAVNQSASFDDQYLITERLAISFRDDFIQSSSVLDQPNALIGPGISGSSPSLISLVVPFGERIVNTATAGLSYQFARNGMVGASGDLALIDYPDQSQLPGLFNSNQLGGSAFATWRITESQYIGETYLNSRILAFPPVNEFNLHTQTLLSFYTFYFDRAFSISVAGGPQYVHATQGTEAPYQSWTPAVVTSLGWQTDRANIAVNYSRTVTGGGGLIGAFNSNTAGGSASWRMSRAWTLGVDGIYAMNTNVTTQLSTATPGGHSISGDFTVQRSFGEHYIVKAEYLRLHQKYADVGAISGIPDSDQVSVSLSYQFRKPIGR